MPMYVWVLHYNSRIIYTDDFPQVGQGYQIGTKLYIFYLVDFKELF